MKKDYEIRNGLEEWIGGVCRITEGFRRLVVHTEKAQKALWRLFRKIVPLDAVVKLTPKEADNLCRTLDEDIVYGLRGECDTFRVKSFSPDAFMGLEDAVATEEELSYEYEWKDL